MEPHEIENLRRSLAMAPLTPRQTEQLIESLLQAERELRRLRDGLRELLDEQDGV